MAGFIIACSRDRGASPLSGAVLRRCAEHLVPDDITANPPDVREEAGLARAVVNPVPGVRVSPRGVCLGALFEEADWATVGAASPDGTYAIVRHDDDAVELLSDTFGSRTVWYVHTDALFLASTSQRALVALLGSFVPCAETATWLLAAGNLGPDLLLGRASAAASYRHEPAPRSPALDAVDQRARNSTTCHARSLRSSTSRSFATPSSASARSSMSRARPTALTLSGGCDSRSLLVGLAVARKPVTCVTWGLAASLADPKNDAAIARRLAQRFDMPHEYLHLDFTEEPVRDVFSRFLRAGEGRIEDFSGYTDGFKAWERLFADGFATMLRGDCPGWGSPYDPIDETVARSINMHCTLVSDYPEGHLIHRLGLPAQRRPDPFYQRDGETLPQYRDRLYNDYELPTCMAAFNDVKCAYVEVVNPLLGRDVVRVTAGLPDELRHLRVGFEQPGRLARPRRALCRQPGRRASPASIWAGPTFVRSSWRSSRRRPPGVSSRRRPWRRSSPTSSDRSAAAKSRLARTREGGRTAPRWCAPSVRRRDRARERRVWRFAPISPRACTPSCARTPRRCVSATG